MAWKRGSYRPAQLPQSSSPRPTPEQVAADKATIATLQAQGMTFFEAFRATLPKGEWGD